MNPDFIYYFKNTAFNIAQGPKICVISLQNTVQSPISLESQAGVTPLHVFVL